MIKNLKKLRGERKISQQELANVIGTSQQSINKYENHSIEPDIDTLIRLADFFGTSVDYLIGKIADPDENEKALSAEELFLISSYRTLSEKEKDCVKTVINTLRRR